MRPPGSRRQSAQEPHPGVDQRRCLSLQRDQRHGGRLRVGGQVGVEVGRVPVVPAASGAHPSAQEPDRLVPRRTVVRVEHLRGQHPRRGLDERPCVARPRPGTAALVDGVGGGSPRVRTANARASLAASGRASASAASATLAVPPACRPLRRALRRRADAMRATCWPTGLVDQGSRPPSARPPSARPGLLVTRRPVAVGAAGCRSSWHGGGRRSQPEWCRSRFVPRSSPD